MVHRFGKISQTNAQTTEVWQAPKNKHCHFKVKQWGNYNKQLRDAGNTDSVIRRKEKLIPTGGNWEGKREETIIALGLGGWKGRQETDVRPSNMQTACWTYSGD